MLMKRNDFYHNLYFYSSFKTTGSAFNTLVEVLETANNNDKQLLDYIRIPVFSAISTLLQHSRAENHPG